MNWFMRKSVLLLLSLTLAAGVSAPSASAGTGYKIKIDGQTYSTNSIIQNGNLLVPAAFLRKAGITVSWDQRNQAVRLKQDDKQLSLPAETYQSYVWTGYSWEFESLKTKTKNKPDGTYVPLRYAVERLGMQITYVPETATIQIRTGQVAAASTFSTFSTATAKSATDKSEELYWLYQLTESEAGGETHKGKVAVAASVLNRVGHPDWPDTLKGVIFQIVVIDGKQYYQYSPVLDGRIYEVKPSKDTINAVNEAYEGADPTKGAVVFYNPDKTDNQWVRNRPVIATIGNHVFAK